MGLGLQRQLESPGGIGEAPRALVGQAFLDVRPLVHVEFQPAVRFRSGRKPTARA